MQQGAQSQIKKGGGLMPITELGNIDRHRGGNHTNQHSVHESLSSRIHYHHEENKADNGNIIGLACGPLKKKRYINPKIEQELIDFKHEIEDKFKKSPLKSFKFPLRK